jgi:hypothetical protein
LIIHPISAGNAVREDDELTEELKLIAESYKSMKKTNVEILGKTL